MLKIVTTITALLFISTSCFAQTTVSGQIRNNTTWTKSGSPYVCNGLIEIAPNITLTIEPGVVVNMGYSNIDIYGKLIVDANVTDSVKFFSNKKNYEQHGIRLYKPDSLILKYCYLENLTVNSMTAINFLSISNCKTNHTKTIFYGNNNSQLIYTNNTVVDGLTTFSGNSSIKKIEISGNTIANCTNVAIRGNAYNGVYKITNNKFTNNEWGCLSFSSTDSVEISNNVFHNNANATLEIKAPSMIHDNIFSHNEYAIQAIRNKHLNTSSITSNSIYGNKVGIRVIEPDEVNQNQNYNISNNCLYDNSEYSLYWNSDKNISIGSNWWGSTDTNSIDSSIYDYKDDFKTGTVLYTPYLTNKNNCKTYTPPAGITEYNNEQNTQVYPNPFNNELNFKADNKQIKEVQLYNLVGKLIYKGKGLSKSHTINTTQYPTGVYIYKLITTDNKIETGKVIKN